MTADTYPYEENGYTLYSYKICPFALRSLRALDFANVPFKTVEIDLKNKPDWYHLVNPQLKVPALRTPEGDIIIESLVISEYVADKFPEAQLLSADPTERAQLRLFFETFSTRLIPHIFGTLRAATKEEQESAKKSLLAGIKEVNDELIKQSQRSSGKGGPFWYGNRFSLAEINSASFINLLVAPAHWRGFSVPQTEEFAAYNEWAEAIYTHPVFTKFQPQDSDIVEALKKFVPEANGQ
ncbi:thioredoxin-like protein [Martensiomyces pterosporus]|nr:thioredoxin-like protein [Martensiomyces pterosporus]